MDDIKDSEIRIIGKDKKYDKDTVPINSAEGSASHRMPGNHSLDTQQESEMSKSSSDNQGKSEGHYNKPRDGWSIRSLIILIVLFFIVANVAYFIFRDSETTTETAENNLGTEELENAIYDPDVPEGQFETQEPEKSTAYIDSILTAQPTDATASYCQIKETEINGIKMKILIPMGAVAKFEVGKISEKDKDIILALQAADIRRDNGEIVGACVYNGEVVGKGLAKKGYVSIINGKVRVGVTDHSPLFEEAIQEGGDFFRQYPLVADGAMVENQPKGKSVRRAICQRGEEILVIESVTPESFHDFAQALQDMQIDNAVYLVGSQYALGFLRDSNNELHTWGESKYSHLKNIRYLVWKKQ